MAETQILVLGPEGVGKTLLLKRLQTISSQQNLSHRGAQPKELGDAPSTIPTVGVNLISATFNKRKFTLRELGGVMGPIWANYFKDASCLLYIIDAANKAQVSSSCIQLLEVLSAKQTQTMSVLLIFNKVDSPSCMSMTELHGMIRLRDIIAFAKQDISVLETSFRDGQHLDEIIKWMTQRE